MEVPTNRSSAEQAAPLILQRDQILQDILTQIDGLQKREPRLKDVDTKPLKEEVLAPLLRNEFDTEVQIRGFLRALQYTAGFKESLGKIGRPDLKEQIGAFIDGKSATEVLSGKTFVLPASKKHGVVGKGKDHKSFVDVLESIPLKFEKAFGRGLPKIYEDQAQTKVMEVHLNDEFVNWGESVKNTPTYTFVPTTVLGIQTSFATPPPTTYASAVAASAQLTSEILISFVNLAEVTTLPDPMSLIPGEYTGIDVPELKTIDLKEQLRRPKRLCRIGAAVTNEEFPPLGRREQRLGPPHRRHHGVVQTVSDPRQLKVAAGAFGLLGIVTHLTFELDAMTYAVMEPRKVDVGLAIPPLRKEDIPPVLRADWYGKQDAEARMESARQEFVRRARDDYYSEWFWFTYQPKAWVNTWNPVDVAEAAVEYPN
ncbi:hypothetical protein GGX14DRAFT_651436, partial [Mycena pura]